MNIPSEFKNATNEWVELKRQLSAARKDMAVLNKKEKELKAYITDVMCENDLDTVTLSDQTGKVNKKTSQKKPPFNRKTVSQGLLVFFDNDQIRVDSAVSCIESVGEAEEVNTITLTQKRT